MRRKKFRLRLPSRVLTLGGRTLVMAVLNVTPDSFSDGGRYIGADVAAARALAMERDGADIIDVGGESTRPGSEGISLDEELRRVLPVLQRLKGRLKIPVSIDTSKAEVAEAAIEAGAEILNDVTGLRRDTRLAEIARRRGAPIILMQMRGEPKTMQNKPFARDVMREVASGLRRAVERAQSAGLKKSQMVVDPGFGFGKSYEQNLEMLARLSEFAKLGLPILTGTSRKGFIGHALGEKLTDERIWGTAATVAASILGGAHIIRVHDVSQMAQVARVTDAIMNAAT